MRSGLPGSFWFIIAATFVARTGFFVESFLTIFMKSEAGFSAGLAAFIMSAYGIGGAIAAFASGPIIDRFGPRIPLLVSLIATAGAAGVLALDPPDWSLFLIVLGIGVVGQVIMPATNAYVAQTVPMNQQRGAFSWVFIALNSGLALGPLIGGQLAGVSFSLMFAVGAGLLVLGAVLAAFSRHTKTAHEPTAPTAVKPLAGMAEMVRDRVFRTYMLLNWLFMALYLQVFVVLPLFMLGDGLTPQDYGIVMAINGASLVLMQLPVDRVLRKFNPARLFSIAALLLALGLALNTVASTLWLYLAAAIFWTLSELINMPLAATVTSTLSPPRLRGSYLAVHGMAFPLGMGLASLIGGSAFVLLPDPKLMWTILAIIGVLLAILRYRTEPGLRARMEAARLPQATASPAE